MSPDDLEFLRAARAAPSAAAVVDASSGRIWSYQDLQLAVSQKSEQLRTGRKSLLFCLCDFSPDSIVTYLAALAAGQAICLIDAKLNANLVAVLLEQYQPDFVAGPAEAYSVMMEREDYTALDMGRYFFLSRAVRPAQRSIHPALAALLPTSGTTGSPKMARLSLSNLVSNAASICDYMELTPASRAITSLPMFYSYGLSVINSHLLAGGTIVVSANSVLRPEFWDDFRRHQCTFLAAVPYQYKMFVRVGFKSFDLPSLRLLTQAGGRLDPELIKEFYEFSRERGARFLVMYGQTEATARISYVPYERLGEKIGSVGIPVPGGKIDIAADEAGACPPNIEGEVVYRGSNVMLGYAASGVDLAQGDELEGVLHTGDCGYLDDDGFLYLTGRHKRMAKLWGLRINLEEVEAALCHAGAVAAVGGEDRITVFVENLEKSLAPLLRQELARKFNVNHNAFAISAIDRLPLTASNKIDYRLLEASLDAV